MGGVSEAFRVIVGEVFRGAIGWYNAFKGFLKGGRVELRGYEWRLYYGYGLVSLVAGCSGKRGSYRVVARALARALPLKN
jgi:hypothetical protein